MARLGRPRHPIDVDQFEKLCAIHATLEEIAGWFKCSADTIEAFAKREYKCLFSEAHKRLSAGGKISLRRIMFQKAQEGNVVMMIWLSKQHLGMSEKMEQRVSTREEPNVVFDTQFGDRK